MRPIFLDIDPANADANGYVNAGTGVGPATLAATSSGDSLAHQLNLTSAANLAAINFTIVGTDADGRAQTEVIAGPNATTVETTNYFLTVSAISWSSTLGASTVDIGWVDEIVTKTIPLDFYRERPPSASVEVTGTIDYTIEVTNDNIQGDSFSGQSEFNWLSDGNFPTGSTGSLTEALSTWPIRACRLRVLSYTNTAELQANIVQAW